MALNLVFNPISGTFDYTLTGSYVPTSEVGQPNGVASLDGSGKVPSSELPSTLLEYQGLWNPNTNTPTLSDSTGTNAYVYQVSANYSGTVPGLNNSTMTNFFTGNLIIYSSSIMQWEQTTPAAGVQSVNSAQGNVTVNAINQLSGDVITSMASGSQSESASLVATSNSTLTSLSALTSASSLATVGTITSGTWNGTTIAIAHGGTGQTTASAAFNALAPTTTDGDMIYYNGLLASNVALGIGTAGQVLYVANISGHLVPGWETSVAGNANLTLSNLTSPTQISVDLLPSLYNAYNIGNSATPWATVNTVENVLYGTTSSNSLTMKVPGSTTAYSITWPSTVASVSGAVLTSDTSGNLSWTSSVPVANGGTGDASFTAYAPIIGGTTSTGALQSAASGISNSGYVLTSTGSSSAPTWQALPASGANTALSNLTTTSINQSLLTQTTGLDLGTGTVTTPGAGSWRNLWIKNNVNLSDGSYLTAGAIVDPNGTAVLLWSTSGRLLYDANGHKSIDVDGRQLSDDNNIPQLSWSTSGVSITTLSLTNALTVGDGGTGGSSFTANQVIIGGTTSTGSLQQVSTGTSGQVLQSNGSSAPTWTTNISGNAANISATSNSTLTTLSALSLPGSQVTGNISGNAANVTGTVAVANGGTGDASFTAYAPVIGGTTSTGALQSAASGISNSGYVLTSTGATSAPTWQPGTGLTGLTIQSGSYTLGTYQTVKFTGLSANSTATLPTAVGATGLIYNIKNADPTYTITVNTTSSQTIDGRASGSIVLAAGLNDFVDVQSDGANWIILAKKETTLLQTSASGSYAANTTNVYESASTSLSLTPGTWRVFGIVEAVSNTGTVGTYCTISPNSGYYAAAGTGTSTPPTSISGNVIGSTIALTQTQLVANSIGGGAVASTVSNFLYTVTSNTTIYLVAQLLSGASSTGNYTLIATAERVW